jgi:hypothetical protein
MQLEVLDVAKGGGIKATDVVDIVASARVQEKFRQIGICKPSISERTARRWLMRLGWKYGRHSNGMYVDGHEQADVVEYRHAFVARWGGYESRFHIDNDGKPLPLPLPTEKPLPHTLQPARLILVTHDESVFFQNDIRQNHWGHGSTNGTPRPKGDGQSLMVSDFLTMEWGPLRDEVRCVIPLSLLASY